MNKISSLFRAPALSCVSLVFTLHFLLFTFNSNAQGLTKYGEITTIGANYIGKNGSIGGSMGSDKYGKQVTAVAAASTLTINHTAGAVAPATVSITYGTVTTSLSGSNKIWITQNLGASVQAASATDATDAAAGWYWQFNRKQGYEVGPTPAWNIDAISETSDWLAANDPCTLELGEGWRIPTQTEWTNADGAPQSWANYTATYNSVLKLHAAGYLNSSGALEGNSRGINGNYWSSTQNSSTLGMYLLLSTYRSDVFYGDKSNGYSLRCLKDLPETVTTSLSGSSKLWITQNLGSTAQATSATDATDAAAGSYYQFNRPQAYKAGPSPAWTITAINESSDWLAANDPCTIELGAGWRIPSQTEWTNVNTNGGWASYTGTYNSVLKLHAAGLLSSSNGALSSRGTDGRYWSSTSGWGLNFGSGYSLMGDGDKAYGFSLRCLKD